jgi:hypothetical protein
VQAVRYVVRNLNRQQPNNHVGGKMWGPRGECEPPIRDEADAFDRASDEQRMYGDPVVVEDTNGSLILQLPACHGNTDAVTIARSRVVG